MVIMPDEMKLYLRSQGAVRVHHYRNGQRRKAAATDPSPPAKHTSRCLSSRKYAAMPNIKIM